MKAKYLDGLVPVDSRERARLELAQYRATVKAEGRPRAKRKRQRPKAKPVLKIDEPIQLRPVGPWIMAGIGDTVGEPELGLNIGYERWCE